MASLFGEVSEWLKEPHSKCGLRVTAAGVRIPPSPLLFFQTPSTASKASIYNALRDGRAVKQTKEADILRFG